MWFRRKRLFVYPIPPAPRTAVLLPEFRSRGSIRVFAQGWCDEAAKFAPQAIAGTLAQLESLSTSVTHAIIVMGRMEDARVSDADRERFWLRFGVPVFEQIVGEDGTLIAAECEAHDGLHFSSDRTTVAGTIDQTLCACGLKSPRLVVREEIGRATSAS